MRALFLDGRYEIAFNVLARKMFLKILNLIFQLILKTVSQGKVKLIKC